MSVPPTVPGSPEAELRALGLRCAVESRASLAVLIPAFGERGLEDAELRQRVLAAFRAQGFTHVAVELTEASEPTAISDASRA